MLKYSGKTAGKLLGKSKFQFIYVTFNANQIMTHRKQSNSLIQWASKAVICVAHRILWHEKKCLALSLVAFMNEIESVPMK